MTHAKTGDTVRIHYTGKLTDGTQFDSSTGRDPLEFQLGAGQVIKGLEKEIDGMEVGTKSTVTIPAPEAYGAHDPAQVQRVERTVIPADIDLQVGMQLGANTQNGNQITLTVTEIGDAEVTLDANHPLAGKDLVFDVELVEVV
ncbi:FKBP-type peptidyl-prolyl cis-trans isomerase [Mariluticola halotolerans]|uniref:FKBP-type peptidyl-prolyl cis-trans isomerase n=1 Tax=Mariluticola halotolerans TaxID=2909283 RepID=UPI0026E1AD25|nr:peptidylprolyl isomerase [Mariluticola halotolerans]UJQ95192.1 peptidylprolyl isomerase [Mariluticola halotolerans]